MELAIYSYSEQEYLQRCENYVERHLPRRLLENAGKPEWARFETNARQRLIDRFGGAWEYNQAVGWLRLYVLGNQLRGTYWFTSAKRVHTNAVRKQFDWQGRALELDISDDQASQDIFAELVEEVREFARSSHIRRRHVDLRPLLLLGPFVDWRALVDASIDAGFRGLDVDHKAGRK